MDATDYSLYSSTGALLRPRVVDSRSEGCQPSRKHYCDVKRNRIERLSGLGGIFHVRFWAKAGSPHYGSSISKAVPSPSRIRFVLLDALLIRSVT